MKSYFDLDVPGEEVDKVAMLVQPALVVFRDDGGNIEKVAVVKVVVVIEPITKVNVGVVRSRSVDNTTPRRLVGGDRGI